MEEKTQVFLHRAWRITEVLLWTAMFLIIYPVADHINNEAILYNWGIGLIGMLIFSGLYLLPSQHWVFSKLRKLYFFLFSFFLSWFLADANQFIKIIQELVQTQV